MLSFTNLSHLSSDIVDKALENPTKLAKRKREEGGRELEEAASLQAPAPAPIHPRMAQLRETPQKAAPMSPLRSPAQGSPVSRATPRSPAAPSPRPLIPARPVFSSTPTKALAPGNSDCANIIILLLSLSSSSNAKTGHGVQHRHACCKA